MEKFAYFIGCIGLLIGIIFWPILLITNVFGMQELGGWVQIIWILLLVAGMSYAEYKGV